jgi:hypothetical protein
MSYQALLLQTMTNDLQNSIYSQNISTGYKKFEFYNNLITIGRFHNFETKITPECLIFTIANNSDSNNLHVLKNFICPLKLHFCIGTNEILKIPLSFLWNLKEPKIIGRKLYLSIPFSLFFGDIHLCGLLQQSITFSLENFNEDAIHHVTGYHLLCKTFLAHARDELQYMDSSNNLIQQISSLHVKVEVDNQGAQSNEFRIRTNIFRGLIKGFFIEANLINGLDEIQFYMNHIIRVDYDKYMIENMCVKINERMIYMPFNNNIAYDNRGYNCYAGSINIDRIDNSFINLKFNGFRKQVRIHALSINIYDQQGGIGSIYFANPMPHMVQDFSYHTLTPIEALLQPYRNLHMSIDGPIFDASLNDVPLHAVSYVSQTLHRLIEDEDRNSCPITQISIGAGERYMLCEGCKNCYNEMSVIQWFQSLNNNNRQRTCPTCREIWRDYNVYINSIELNSIEGNIILTNID